MNTPDWWLHAFGLLILIVEICASFNCNFDSVKPEVIAEATVQYLKPGHETSKEAKRHKRNQITFDRLFRPIRLKTHFFNSTDISQIEQERLVGVIEGIISVATQLFSVIPVEGALLLRRTGCVKVWESGANAGKCAVVKARYSGESCVDPFKIPNDHLEGLNTWNRIDVRPTSTFFPAGRGLKDTDYIVYVQSSYVSACLQGGLNIIAYAAYCQTDQFGRPIAGYINICPRLLRDPYFNFDKVSKTALHELFHALGFSSDLFGKFRRCQLSGNGNDISCSSYSSATVRLLNGARRLITPMVSRLSSQHFNCSHQEGFFGPILETENNEIRSHWDATFMQGSIMAPSVLQPHLVIIDNITLAVFEDSGWYKVNYQFAENFVWGRGGGCNFGLSTSCHQTDTNYFCQNSTRGCHHMHLDKGVCSTSPFLHKCRIYRSPTPNTCQVFTEEAAEDESFTVDSRCFFSNLSRSSTEGDLKSTSALQPRCYEHRCSETGQLQVKLYNSTWFMCPYGKSIRVEHFDGVIRCPAAGVLCSVGYKWKPGTSSPPPDHRNNIDISSHVTDSNCSLLNHTNNSTVLWLELHFENVSNNMLDEDDQRLFIELLLNHFSKILSLCKERFTSEAFHRRDEGIVFTTAVLNADYGHPLQQLIGKLVETVHSHNFTFVVGESKEYRATSLRYTHGSNSSLISGSRQLEAVNSAETQMVLMFTVLFSLAVSAINLALLIDDWCVISS